MSSSSIEQIKSNYLKMPIEEKRLLYKCGGDYVTVDKIKTWQDYFSADKLQLKAEYMKTYADLTKGYSINNDLNRKVSIWNGDITTLEIDTIVNAANKSLMGGGGVDGAIHRAAGPDLKNECSTLNGCETGHAKITGGYNLPAKYVIHTVGPIGEKPELLQMCYESCLKILSKEKLKTIAFPCISTGVYGYPQEAAAHVALNTVRLFLEKNGTSVDRVIFCLFLKEDIQHYKNLLQLYFPVEN